MSVFGLRWCGVGGVGEESVGRECVGDLDQGLEGW